MSRYLLLILFAILGYAKNSTTILDNNHNMTILQSSKTYGKNTINIGNNNRNITINQKIELINSSNKILKNIQQYLKNIKHNKNQISLEFKKLLTTNNTIQREKIVLLRNHYHQLINNNKIIKNRISELKSTIDDIILENNQQIKNLKEQIQNMHNSISFLMKEFYKGNLKTISFYTFHIEGVYIDKYFYKGVGIGYERLYNSSVFNSIALLTTLSFLSGTEDNIIENLNKQIYLFDIGIKNPFKILQTSYSTYGKSNIGYLWGDESSLYLKLGIGMEKFNDKNKIGISLNYLGIFEKEEKKIRTHILGNAEITKYKGYQHGISLEFAISF